MWSDVSGRNFFEQEGLGFHARLTLFRRGLPTACNQYQASLHWIPSNPTQIKLRGLFLWGYKEPQKTPCWIRASIRAKLSQGSHKSDITLHMFFLHGLHAPVHFNSPSPPHCPSNALCLFLICIFLPRQRAIHRWEKLCLCNEDRLACARSG